MRTILRRLLSVSAILYLFGTVFGGMGLGWIALHPPSHPITPQETANARIFASAESQKFSDASITTRNGATLRAWFLQPDTGDGCLTRNMLFCSLMLAHTDLAADWRATDSRSQRTFIFGWTGWRRRTTRGASMRSVNQWAEPNCYRRW